MSTSLGTREVTELHFLDVVKYPNEVVDRIGFVSSKPPELFLEGVRRAAVREARERYGGEITTRFNYVSTKIEPGDIEERGGQVFYRRFLIADAIAQSAQQC